MTNALSILVVLITACCGIACAEPRAWYVSPTGEDAASGTLDKPLASIQRAQAFAKPGDTVFLRGGVYKMRESHLAEQRGIFGRVIVLNKSGEKGQPITYRAYENEQPVFDFSAIKLSQARVTAFYVSGSWLHLKGIEITGVQVGMKQHTQSICVESQGSHNIFERLSMHDGQAIGIYHVRGSNNLFLNCDAWNNWDYTSEEGRGENVDGFGCHPTPGSTGNVFRGCRAWFNSDDGFDCISAHEVVKYENCWAAYNGYSPKFENLANGNGFKVGGFGSQTANQLPRTIPRHVVQDCLAVKNKSSGFYANHHPGGCDWLNNAAFRNGTNFNMQGRLADNRTEIAGYGHKLTGNLSYGSARDLVNIDLAKCELSNNIFSKAAKLSDRDFVSLKEEELWQPRSADGTLPQSDFLRRVGQWKFYFGTEPASAGFTPITPQTIYTPTLQYGYRVDASPKAGQPTATLFAMDLAEGNYEVTMRFGHPTQATSTTIKAEARRLMVEKIETAIGQYETRSFTVNVRRPKISSGGTVLLNGRELGPPVSPSWDDQLTLEFNGPQPGVVSLEIKPVAHIIRLFIAGDSTVADQTKEPYAGWGQMLPRFFSPSVVVSNQAESGLALHSFEKQKRLEKVLSMLQPGDYLFIQFGHNDQKDKSANAGPFTSYKNHLKKFVAAVRKQQGIPVLVTPLERRRFDADSRPTTTLAEYAAAVKQVGDEDQVPVIDLHAMSLQFYNALGEERSKQAFAFYAANTFPGQTEELKDNTHHNPYGAYELARCVVKGIETQIPALAQHLTKDAGAFDPVQPDQPEALRIPLSPWLSPTEKPAGN